MSGQQGNRQSNNGPDWLVERLTRAVAEKLGASVAFSRWERLPTGADLPIFTVPAERVAEARALGLTVEAA